MKTFYKESDVAELLLFYKSHKIQRYWDRAEFTLYGSDVCGDVTVHFTCRKAEHEPKLHHLDNYSTVVVLLKAVGYMSEGRTYYLHDVLNDWQSHWIQFMSAKALNNRMSRTYEIIEAASVYPPGLRSRKHRRPFPFSEEDRALLHTLELDDSPM